MSFESEVSDIANDIVKLLVKKRHDYGNSFERIWEKFGAVSVVVRLNDKLERLNNLVMNTHEKPVNESIEDTFKDIIGYCLLALRMTLKKQSQEVMCNTTLCNMTTELQLTKHGDENYDY